MEPSERWMHLLPFPKRPWPQRHRASQEAGGVPEPSPASLNFVSHPATGPAGWPPSVDPGTGFWGCTSERRAACPICLPATSELQFDGSLWGGGFQEPVFGHEIPPGIFSKERPKPSRATALTQGLWLHSCVRSRHRCFPGFWWRRWSQTFARVHADQLPPACLVSDATWALACLTSRRHLVLPAFIL